ncbi:hypothetical protein KIV40_30525, partial [Vibrio sp. D173a]|nr:hypothetical protein [Vibrio sp. D173a]
MRLRRVHLLRCQILLPPILNANFTALDQDISSLGTEVDDLTGEVDSIEARVTSLEDSGVSSDAYSTVDINCSDDADSL